VKGSPARKLAAAGTAGLGVAAAAAAYVIVSGLPGVLYAAGICLAAFVGAVAIVAGGTEQESAVADLTQKAPEPAQAPRPPRWRRKKHIIAELRLELATTVAELEEHRQALANLAAQLSRESEAAQRNALALEQRIRELEAERDGLVRQVAEEREGFERTLDELGGGLGRHGNELAELERELEALIAR
jgi:chromosome segregation ATPase